LKYCKSHAGSACYVFVTSKFMLYSHSCLIGIFIVAIVQKVRQNNKKNSTRRNGTNAAASSKSEWTHTNPR